MTVNTLHISILHTVSAKLKDYALLVKFRLSSLVVFSSAFGYLFAVHNAIDWYLFTMICLGGFFTTAASNALNQVIEKDFDALMNRTKNRPLPATRMTSIEAILVAGIMAVIGIAILWIYFNQLAALFSSVALISYAFIYTPLKRFSPIAVFVGAFPGALPPLIGYVAATNRLDHVALLMFGIQFMWQFPHFWAIAWVAFDDYMRAGYKLLPSSEGRTKYSALQIIISIILLIPISLLPYYLGTTGIVSGMITLVTGLLFLYQSIELYRQCSLKSARSLMFGSFAYLPIVQIALLLDRINS